MADPTDSVFEALAHPARRHILVMLNHLGGELPSGYLASRFAHSWPTTTRHLRVLEQAGLVEVRREGRGSHYRLIRDRATEPLRGLLKNLTPPGPAKTWKPAGPRHTQQLRESKR